MKILELDFGNSSLKWRVINDGLCGVSQRWTYQSDKPLECTVEYYDRVRVASVLSEDQTQQYLSQFKALAVEIVRSERAVAGFQNNYQYPEKLGVDRWLAALAAYRDAGDKACLVIDLGTAITVDFISDSGVFEGGYILAGRELLQSVLLKDTAQVRYADEAGNSIWPNWPTTTAQAVQWGAGFVLRAIVEAARVQAAAWQKNNNFAIYLTGGDAKDIAAEMGNAVHYRPDLVLDGLSVAIP